MELQYGYKQYCLTHAWDETYGYLIPPTHQVQSFDMALLEPFLGIISDEDFIEKMKDFPYLGPLKYHENRNDMLILHDLLVAIINKYLALAKRQQKKHEQVTLHENLCLPLYELSRSLAYKASMTTNFSYNWVPLNNKYIEDPVNFSLDDFQLRWLLTEDQHNQRYFFGASVVGAFNLARVVKACYQMQVLIEKAPQNIAEIKKRLEISIIAMDKIVRTTTIMYKYLDPKFFYQVLRPMTMGYNNLLLKGVKDSEGKEVRLTLPGGAGGYDPSFQLFQSAFGIVFTGDYKETQDTLAQEGMIPQHKAAINGWRELQKQGRPNIRNYCKKTLTLKPYYNDVLRKYMQFLNLHSNVIVKFIMNHVPQHCRATIKGTGDTLITRIMKRYESLKDQFLE